MYYFVFCSTLKEMVRKQVPATVQASQEINYMLSEFLEPKDNKLNDTFDNLKITKQSNIVTEEVSENTVPQTELNLNVTEITKEITEGRLLCNLIFLLF